MLYLLLPRCLQLLMVLLCILGITLPFVITSFMDQLWVGVIASFVIMTAFWSVNETAVELDEPFGTGEFSAVGACAF